MDRAAVISLAPPLVHVEGSETPVSFTQLAQSQYVPVVGDVVTVLPLVGGPVVALGLWSQIGTSA